MLNLVLILLPITITISTTLTQPVLKTKTSDSLGDYITDGNGRALYIFEDDKPNISRCNSRCSRRWKPYLAGNIIFPPPVSNGLRSRSVGLFERTDGKYKLTYKKQPLYYYYKDTRKSTKGHKRKQFGGRWSLINSDGTAIYSPLSNSYKNLPDKTYIIVPGAASMLLLPDSFVVLIEITAQVDTISNSVGKIKEIYLNLNKTEAIDPDNINLIEKRIDADLAVSYKYKAIVSDKKKLIDLVRKIKEVNDENGNSDDDIEISTKGKWNVKEEVSYLVSSELISNTQSEIYKRAVTDAFENANKLLGMYNMEVKDKNKVKSIYVDSSEMEDVIKDSGSKSGGKVMKIRVKVSYNTQKKEGLS